MKRKEGAYAGDSIILAIAGIIKRVDYVCGGVVVEAIEPVELVGGVVSQTER